MIDCVILTDRSSQKSRFWWYSLRKPSRKKKNAKRGNFTPLSIVKYGVFPWFSSYSLAICPKTLARFHGSRDLHYWTVQKGPFPSRNSELRIWKLAKNDDCYLHIARGYVLEPGLFHMFLFCMSLVFMALTPHHRFQNYFGHSAHLSLMSFSQFSF